MPTGTVTFLFTDIEGSSRGLVAEGLNDESTLAAKARGGRRDIEAAIDHALGLAELGV